MNQLVISAKYRKLLYGVIAVTSPLVTYLGETNKLDSFWVGLYAVIVTAVTGLALSKTSDK